MSPITYSILRVSDSVDNVTELGGITKEEAIKLFETFPFQEELAKKKSNPEFVIVPTITFTNSGNETNLAIWKEENSTGYTVYLPESLFIGDNIEFDNVKDCIVLFFDYKVLELQLKMNELKKVTQHLLVRKKP